MFYFNLFGMEAVFDERKNTLTYGGETIYYSTSENNEHLRTLYFKFNDICNLRCSYCFQRNSKNTESRNLEIAEYKGLLNRIVNTSSFDRFILFGGEPFIQVNYNNILYLLELCNEKKICAFSNGTFDDIYMKLLADNLNKIEMITITLDGDSVIHNRRRIYSNGKGTFQDIYNRLIRMQEMGIPFTVQINIDTENIENLYSLLNQMSKDLLGVSCIILNRVLHEENGISELDLLQYYNKLKKTYTKLNIIPNSQCYKKLCSIITDNGIIYGRCGIENMLVFDFQSNLIYACPQSEITRCGSFTKSNYCLDRDSILNYKSYSDKSFQECSDCDMRSLCMFGCNVEKDCKKMGCYEQNRECIQYILNHFVEFFDLEEE
ncbi:MAG: radical SAM protein [Lachnospiraceae bacterium]|nr:radical SAM protein [Lachnospiraceae bacterium]